jgi:hypothetical protein
MLQHNYVEYHNIDLFVSLYVLQHVSVCDTVTTTEHPSYRNLVVRFFCARGWKETSFKKHYRFTLIQF